MSVCNMVIKSRFRSWIAKPIFWIIDRILLRIIRYITNNNVPLTSKNACRLCLCLLHSTNPKPRTNKQRHPRLKPKIMAILWAFFLLDGNASRETNIFFSQTTIHWLYAEYIRVKHSSKLQFATGIAAAIQRF
jgi:hypothetical protein